MKKIYFFVLKTVVGILVCLFLFEQITGKELITGELWVAIILCVSLLMLRASIVSERVLYAALWASGTTLGMLLFFIIWIGIPRGIDWLLPIIVSLLIGFFIPDYFRKREQRKTIFPE